MVAHYAHRPTQRADCLEVFRAGVVQETPVAHLFGNHSGVDT